MQDLTGHIIKGYALRELVSQGGFGVVYRAMQGLLEREVAVKVILPEFANHPDFIRRFEVEAQLIARLEHFHIVPLYDYWREPNSAYLVMRWLKGGSLRQVLNKGMPALPQVITWIDQISGALAVAHRNGVIHQDLKPDNILLDDDQNAYLIDFGIAKDISQPDSSLEKQALLGTPAYIAPEQILRQPISPQTDLYSLGIMLYELLTGEIPFFDASQSTTLYKQVNEPLPSLQKYRADLPDVLDDVIQRATAKVPAARYPDALSFAADVRQFARPITVSPFISPGRLETETAASLGENTMMISLEMTTNLPTAVLESGTVVVTVDAPVIQPNNPYKGLRPFTEADASDFYGREALVSHLVERLHTSESNFLALIGASGSGKSSVIRAGLIPTLRRGALPGSERWFYTEMVPGLHPFEELAAALLSIASNAPENLSQTLLHDDQQLARTLQDILPDAETPLLLFIDQFEEVFTLVPEAEERRCFLNSLMNALQALDSRLRIIITIRADFYDRPLQYPGFGELIRSYNEVVLPLTPKEMQQAVVAPAEGAGLTLENGLVDAMIHDVQEQPGALPLLQYALTELFERRQGNLLTLEAYRDSGGVLGALARRADEIYDKLSAEAKEMTRQVFLRLVVLGEGVDDTRLRVSQGDLLSITGNRRVIQQVLDTYGKYRLLAFDHDPQTRTPTVEVAHEAIIRKWDRLQGWLNSNRENLRIQRRLSAATSDWISSGRNPSFLASGARLVTFETLLDTNVLSLTREERDYLNASIALRKRAAQRLQIAAAALVLFSVGALLLALFAFNQRSRAQASEAQALVERDRADEQARASRSRELAVNALTNRAQLDLSLLLSLEAFQIADTFEANHSLLTGLQSQPHLTTFLHGHTEAVRSVAFSPDGRFLASGSRDGKVLLWDAASRTLLRVFEEHTAPINRVAFSPDGTILAAASSDGTISLWNVATGTRIGEPLTGHEGAVWGLAFSPDSRRLASGGEDFTIRLWDVATQQLTGHVLEGHEDAVWVLAFSPDGKYLASGSADNTVRLWDVALQQVSGAPLSGHDNWIWALAFSPDGQQLASAGADGMILLWDVASRRAEQIVTTHTDWIRGLAFNADGSILASAGEDRQILLWDVEALTPLGTPLNGHTDEVWSIAFAPDGTLVSGGKDRQVIFWNLAQDHLIERRLTGHTQSIMRVHFSRDGTRLFSAGGNPSGETTDATVRVWDVATGENLATWEGHSGAIWGLALSPDGKIIASGGEDGQILLQDSTTGEQLSDPLTGHSSFIYDLAFHPNGKLLASASDDQTIRLWDIATGESEILTGHDAGVLSIAFSPDGKKLVAGSLNGTLYVWDAATLKLQADPTPAHQDAITSLTFSPNGQYMVSASRDHRLILWDAVTMQPVGQPFTGHTDWVIQAAFNPDSTLIASASQDGKVILWDVATGRQLGRPFEAHSDWVLTVAFGPNGKRLASGGFDSSIILWDINVQDWQAAACQIANRNLNEVEWAQYFYTQKYHPTCPTRP